MNNFFRRITNQDNFRLYVFSIVVIILFIILVIKLYTLQIIDGDYYSQEVTGTTLREVEVTAARGSIYDRYGRVLATNEASYVVNIDPSVGVENMNDILVDLITLLENNNESIDVSLPITTTLPRAFLLDGSETREKRWKDDMSLDKELNATETYDALKEKFEISSDLSDDMVYKILAIRCELYKNRYSKYLPVSISYNVSEKTVTAIQEQASMYPCIFIDTQSSRVYPKGKYLSHILGYTGKITDTELENNSDKYSINDYIGKDGIEKSFEDSLRGVDGSQYIEVDSFGRRISVLENEGNDSKSGGNVYLTIDSELQKTIYDELENELINLQIKRMSGGDFSYGTKDVFLNMIKSDSIWMQNILNSKEGTTQGDLKEYILSSNPKSAEDINIARETLAEGYDKGYITTSSLIIALYEQGQITDEDNIITRLKNGTISPSTALIQKMYAKEITPQMTGMDPCTGSVVVTDVETGDVLAAVSYPSYDNNELVNNFNNEYYIHLQNDPTTPMVNRPFTEPRAPGSTFKMISAIAALEEGIITPNSEIYDYGTFKDAGKPYARCWINSGSGSHGSVNVASALEVSCNYFFYTVSYKCGIDILNKYMEAFGLNSPTGVEIYELYDSMTNYPSYISSPDYKRYIVQSRNPDTPERDIKWNAGDTIRTAIGQSYNNYTSAILSKYIATLANGGTRYSMHLLNKTTDNEGNVIQEYEPIIEEQLNIKKENLEAVFKGMNLVTKGSSGTLRNSFSDYNINVAAKSGTAQESDKRSEHTIFVGFAPYEDPQISVAVLIPFGNDKSAPAPKIAKAAISKYLQTNSAPETKYYNTLIK